jgi:hypothetical protein
MKTFKQIDLSAERRWIWSYTLTMMFLTVFIVARPVYAEVDRNPESVPLEKSPFDGYQSWLEGQTSEADSIVFNTFLERYNAYHRAHLLLFREYFGPGLPARARNNP